MKYLIPLLCSIPVVSVAQQMPTENIISHIKTKAASDFAQIEQKIPSVLQDANLLGHLALDKSIQSTLSTLLKDIEAGIYNIQSKRDLYTAIALSQHDKVLLFSQQEKKARFDFFQNHENGKFLDELNYFQLKTLLGYPQGASSSIETMEWLQKNIPISRISPKSGLSAFLPKSYTPWGISTSRSEAFAPFQENYKNPMDMYMDMGINSAQLTELNTLIFYAHGIPAVRVPLRGWEYLFYLTPNKKWKATNGNIPNNSVTSGDINMSTMEFLFMTELEAQDTWIPALNAILDPDLKKQAEFKKHQPHNPLLWEIYLNNLKQANAPLEKELGEALTAINPISSKYASDLLEKYAKVINPIIREDLLCYLIAHYKNQAVCGGDRRFLDDHIKSTISSQKLANIYKTIVCNPTIGANLCQHIYNSVKERNDEYIKVLDTFHAELLSSNRLPEFLNNTVLLPKLKEAMTTENFAAYEALKTTCIPTIEEAPLKDVPVLPGKLLSENGILSLENIDELDSSVASFIGAGMNRGGLLRLKRVKDANVTMVLPKVSKLSGIVMTFKAPWEVQRQNMTFLVSKDNINWTQVANIEKVPSPNVIDLQNYNLEAKYIKIQRNELNHQFYINSFHVYGYDN